MTISTHGDDIVAVGKPPGSPHTPPSAGTARRCSADCCSRASGSAPGIHERQGIVQRLLDVGTSGVMVVTSEHAAAVLEAGVQTAHRGQAVSRCGARIIWTRPAERSTPYRPPPRPRLEVRRDQGGRHSITHYDTLEMFRAASLLDIHLETGRTHQIRVHFAALHHPCAGDLTYGADPVLARRLGLERQWLHARSLAFAHPADGRRIEITSPYPAGSAARSWTCCAPIREHRTLTHDARRRVPGLPPMTRRLLPVGACFRLLQPAGTAGALEIPGAPGGVDLVLLLGLLAVVGRLSAIDRRWFCPGADLDEPDLPGRSTWGRGLSTLPRWSPVLGVVMFGERLKRLQKVAVTLAVAAVVILTTGLVAPTDRAIGLAPVRLPARSRRSCRPTRGEVAVETAVAAPFAITPSDTDPVHWDADFVKPRRRPQSR